MARNQTATARVMDSKAEPIAATSATLSGGLHITAKGLALVVVGNAEEKRLDVERLQNLSLMLASSEPAEVDAAIRGAEKTEKVADDNGKLDTEAPANYGPAVVEMVRLGMTIKTARVRISEVRAIVKATRAGYKIKPAKGWHKTIADARNTLETKREADAANKDVIFRRDMLSEGLAKFGGDVENPDGTRSSSPEAIRKAEAYASERIVAAALEAEAEASKATVERMAKRIKDMGEHDAIAVCKMVCANFHYDLRKLSKAEIKKQGVIEADALAADVGEREPATTH